MIKVLTRLIKQGLIVSALLALRAVDVSCARVA